MRRVIQEIHVQVTVRIEVEEGLRLRGVANVFEAEVLGAVGERAVTVVHVQHVAAAHRWVADGRDIDVNTAVSVDVGHCNAGLPAIRAFDPRAFGDVFEAVTSPVTIESVGAEVGREVEVLQTVAVHVSYRDTAAVVVVQVVENVEFGAFRDIVAEGDAGGLGR